MTTQDIVRDPSLMYGAWVAHWFPGFKPHEMIELRWATYVSMWDTIKE